MRRVLIVSLAAIALLGAAGFWLYERYIGFERSPIETRLPADTQVFVSVRHVRKAALDILADEQLKTAAGLVQAVVVMMLPASLGESEASETLTPLNQQALNRLARHFKGQLALAALPVAASAPARLEWLLAAHFSGDPDDFSDHLLQMLAGLPRGPTDEWRLERLDGEGGAVYKLKLPPRLQAQVSADWPWLGEPVTPSWSIRDGILWLCASPSALQRTLQNVEISAKDKASSLAALPALADLPKHLPQRDFDLYVSGPAALAWGEEAFSRWKAAQPSSLLLNSFSLPRALTHLGVAGAESLLMSLELSGDRPLYLGLRYSEKQGLWRALRPTGSLPEPLPLRQPILAAESMAADLGTLLLGGKDAVVAGNPLIGLGYMALRSKLLQESGQDLERLLSEGFAPETSLYHTVDIGIGIDGFGRIGEVVSPDTLLVTRLREPGALESLIQAQVARLQRAAPRRVAQESIQGIPVLLFPPPGDASLTVDTTALAFAGDRMLIGYGTLTLFNDALEIVAEDPEGAFQTRPAAEREAGSGELRIERLPARLPPLAVTFYRQMNPGYELPLAFRYFDWQQLEALHSRRSARSIDDDEGHLYRISRQQDRD